MAFQAGDLVVSGSLPLLVKRSDKMAHVTVLWRREDNGQGIEINSPRYYHED